MFSGWDGGNAWGGLRDKMPKIVRAEEKAWAKMAWELIYKWRATLNGNYPLKPGLGPLALLCLLTPSLNPPCYNGSASDSTMFHDARFTNLPVLLGKYYLVDTGFPICETLLIPYWGVHYHLTEWGHAGFGT